MIRSLFCGIAVICAASASAQVYDYPFRDPGLSPEQRAADLCSRLSLEEKAALMMNSSRPIERLGVPAFEWWSEALHGIGRNGLATVFPSCIGMAASFDDDLIEEVFTAVSDEGRAKNTYARHAGGESKYKGLSFWTPNVNVFRDPRWGRGQETYGEDPYMNGRMGLRVVRGLQGDGSSPYFKLLACAKHYAVHSGPEKTRHFFDIESLPPRDLWETYLPAFRTLVTEGGVRQVMCAYQRFEGSPCCGSDRLLQSILRDEWGFDGVVVSDCGAIDDFYRPGRHEVADDATAASAMGVRAGTDVECGSVYKHLPEAVRRGDISQEDIDRSVMRLLTERFRLGAFDPDSLVPWTRIPLSVVACDAHLDLARRMGREQMVLLKNNGVLPLAKDASRIMVMGPNAADSVMTWGIYYGQPSHTVTVLEGVVGKVGPVAYFKGCGITDMVDETSVFSRFVAPDGRKGMLASYWNNTSMQGAPVVQTVYDAPVKFDTGGNTVFEPGVNLTDFTLRLQGSYTPDQNETLSLLWGNDDGFRIIVNGDTVYNRWRADRVNFYSQPLKVKKGQKYDIVVEYMQLADGASMNFDLASASPVTPGDVVRRAADAEVVVFVGGISPLLEREEKKVNAPGFDNGDRSSIELPQAQRDILRALHDAGKKVVLVNCSGSAVALAPEAEFCDAILQAWYPGQQGGNAVADVLFGDFNPCGKLPVTFYSCDAQLPDFDDYRMNGRTYRYLLEEPLYHFGYGLSYTDFSFGTPSFSDGVLSVDVTNTGSVEGTEVVQVYLRRVADTDGPLKSLRGYQRVTLAPGQTRTVMIDLPASSFENWDTDRQCMRVVEGEYRIMVGPSSRDSDLQSLSVEI